MHLNSIQYFLINPSKRDIVMNKIFKVVWNRTIGSFVVTSELAKGHVKSSSEGSEGDVRTSWEGRLKTLFRLTALSAALLGFSEGAWAEIPEGSATGGATFAIGKGTTSANGTGALAIGNNAQAKDSGALAIGPNSTHTTIANSNNSIAIGVNLRSTGQKAIGIGADTTVNGTGAIAIGNNDSGRMANQGVNGNGAIGVGSNLTVNGNNAIAMGTEAQAKAISAVAVGANTQATGVEAVAIGKGAQATKQGSIAIGVNTIATGVKPPRADGKAQTDDGRAIAIGYGVQATGEDSIAIGKSEGANLAQATTKQSLAIGWTAQATGATQAVAIGPDAIASGTQSTSIGNNTRATGDSSIAIGGDDWNIVRTKQVAAAGNKQVHQVYQELTGMEMKQQGEAYNNPFKGTTAGDAAVAIGVAALAEGTLSTAFGSGTSASGVGASAFGVGATASKDKSVAIGAGSHTNTDATRETAATVNGITYSGFAGADHITSGSQVSFGSAGFERQLKHVAPGAIASTSTDAVNGSQLFAIAKDMRAAQTHFYSVKSEDHTKGNYNNDGAKGEHSLAAGEEASATANSATAVGQKALASGEAAIAVGSETKAAASNAVVIGNRAAVEEVAPSADSGTTTGLGSVAVGAVSKASGTNATAIGQAANAFGQNSFAGGQASKALGKSSVALGDGANAIKDSAVALGAYTNANNAGATAVGFNSNALGWASFAGGHSARAEASSAVALGHQAQAVGGKAVAIGKDSHAAEEGTIALGDGAKATKGNSVAIGAGSTTATDATIVNEAKVNDLKYSGFAGGSKVTAGDQVSFGSAGHERQLKHVAPGDISKDSTDAVNGSQLYAIQSVLANTAKTVKNVLGGDAAVGEDGSITMSNIGDTGAENIHNAIKSVKETAEKGWNLKANDDADREKIAAGDTVTVKQGKNIRVKRSGKELTVETSDDVEFANVKAASVETASVVADSVIAGNSVLTTDGLKIGADSSPNQVSLTTAGLNNGGNKITKVAEGTLAADSTDAVNGAQLYKVDQKADTNAGNIAKGINIGGTSNSNKYGLGDTVNIKGDSNIVSDTVKGGVQLKLAETVKIGQDSGKPVSIDGVNGTVSGLSNTTLGNAPLAGSDKAATEAQLDATQVNLATILGGNAANNNGNVMMTDIGDTGKANIHDAIKSVKETAEKGWKLKVNEETSAQAEKISPDDEVAIKQGKNITVTRDDKNITVATSEDVEFNTVNATTAIAETVIAGNSVLNTDGLKIGDDSSPNQVSLTTSGLNNGDNKIAKVAKGMEDTDGVNVSQIKPLATALNTTVGADGSIAEPNFTVNHADGTAGTPVHTVQDALNEVGKELNKGLNIVADNGSSEKVNLGDTVTYTSKDKNIVTTSGTGKAIDFSLAEKVTIGKDAANGGKPVVIDGKEGIVSGLTNTTLGSAPLAGSDKAATEAQLDATQVNLKNILGGNAANNNGNVTTNNIGGTGKDNVHDAIKSVKETAEKGWNLKANDETSSEKIAAGDTVTVKQGKNIRVKRSGKELTVETSDDVEFGTVSATTVLADSFISGNSVLSGEGLKIGADGSPSQVSLTNAGLNNGGNKISNVATGEADTDAVNVAQLKSAAAKATSKVDSGNDNIVVTPEQNADGSITYKVATAPNLKADSLTAGETVVNNSGVTVGDKVALSKDGLKAGDVNITADGIDAGNKAISNVAKGVKATDAVNVAQLNEQLAATEKTTTVVAGKNVTVSEKVDGNNTEYTVNADKTTLSQAANGAVKVSEGAKDADGVTDYALDLTDEAKADIAKGVAAKDAVDNKGLTFAADNGTTGAKKLGDSLSVKGDGNILTRADENGIGFSLADKITVGKAGKGNKPLVIDGTAGLISGLSNTTLGGADFATKGQAASEEQLNATQANLANLLGGNAANDKGNVTTTDIGGTGKDNVHDAIAAVKETADKGWNLNANDETSSEKIGAGDTVTFKEGKNVKVSRNGKNITVATSDDVSFDKVTVGGSVLTDNGLTVGNGKAGKPVSLTKDGLNNGGNKVSDIAAGEADTDAVNVAQLKAAAAKATSKVDSGNDNIVVTPEQNADGSTTYKVATAPNLKADSFTAGDTVVNNDGVKVGDKVALGKDGLKAGDVNITTDGINAGNKAIGNVAAGVKDTDAANVGQLNRLTAAAKTEVEAGTNIASVTSKQGANGQTVYTVNADGASVSAGSDNIVVTKGNKDADNVTDYAVDLSKAVKADIAKGVAAKDAVDNKGISFAGDSGTTVANKLGDTVAVKGDANITTTAGANGIQVGLNKDLKVDSVKAGDTVVNNNGVNVGDKVALGKDGLKAGDVNITADGINAGGKKVTGVAAGTVAAGSTDAVNGGQLHQVYELIGSNGGNVNTAPPSVEADGKAGLGNIKNITLVDNSNNPNVTNVTNETKIAQSNGYSLVTYNVEDQGMYVTNNVIEAVGRMNEQGIKFFHTNDGEVEPDVQAYNGEDSSASGAYATAVGFQAASKGTNAIAIGKGAQANAENTIAIGTGNIVSGKNSGAIGDPTVVSGNSSYSIGNNNNVSADNAYALGSNIKATVNDSVYLGDRAQSQGIRTADAAKGEAYTYGGLNDKAVAGKAGSTAAANKVAGVVTVGNGTDETRQVQGVAAGVVSADSTDAINGSQLYYTNQAINQSVTNIGNYVVNMGNQINQRIDNVESDSKAGTAAAMAVAGLPQAYLPGKSMMAVAGGVYRGESGYAVGFSSISDGGNWVIKGTATGNSRGHYGATAGVGYQW